MQFWALVAPLLAPLPLSKENCSSDRWNTPNQRKTAAVVDGIHPKQGFIQGGRGPEIPPPPPYPPPVKIIILKNVTSA